MRLSCFLLVLTPAAVAAQTWGLTWKSPAECLQAAELAERVERKLGQPLFVATAPRSVEGHLEKTTDQWRARFTIVDANGKILGTRELEQSVVTCRDLDERLVFLVVLLIRPIVELEAAPPAPREVVALPPAPRPVRPRLQVRGDERLVDGLVVALPVFHQRLGRADLVDQYWARFGLKTATGVLAGVLLLTAVVALSASALGADCVRWSGTPQAPGRCVDRSPGALVSALITAVLGTGGVIAAVAYPSAPTSQAEDERLVKEYEAR